MPEITIDSPKMLKEVMCVLEHGLLQGDIHIPGPLTTDTVLKYVQELIRECDVVRPVGPDGKHGDRHTADCGCLDKKMNFCVHCKQRIVWSYNSRGWAWFHVESRMITCYAGEMIIAKQATPIQPAYLGKEEL